MVDQAGKETVLAYSERSMLIFPAQRPASHPEFGEVMVITFNDTRPTQDKKSSINVTAPDGANV